MTRARGGLHETTGAPLRGTRVLVTRAAHQAATACAALRDLGADPIVCPVIDIAPPEDLGPLDRAIRQLDEYDWVVFTSANGVDVFARRMRELGVEPSRLGQHQVAAIGPATAARLADENIYADVVPQEFVAEAVAAALVARGIAGRRVLLPRAADARSTLPELLRAAGAAVDVLAVYRTVFVPPPADALQRLRRGEIDVVLLTSSSTARGLVRALGGDTRCLEQATVACIGPVTAETARTLGLRVDVVSREYTVSGLLQAVVEAMGERTR